MKINFIFSFVFLLLSTFLAHATIVQKLVLTNGSEMEGYISMQRPGKDFTFATERAVIYMSNEKVKSFVDHEINISDLSKAWKEWGKNNDAFVGLGDNRILLLSDIITETGSISRVRVLEKGAKIKYLEMTPNTYSLNWDTIAVVRVEKRSKTALSGINRIYQLASGMEYEGQYVEEVPGKTLSLYRDNGVVEVFETGKVVKYAMKKINPNQSIVEQSELLDVIQLANSAIQKGIIIEQNYTDDGKGENYLLMQLENGSTQSIKIKDIVEFRKEPNPGYKPQFDILLRKGELVVNRKMTKSVKLQEKDSRLVLESDTCATVIDKQLPATEIIIEACFSDNAEAKQLHVVKLNFAKNKKEQLGFTFEDVVKSEIRPVLIETSVNNTTKMKYDINQVGVYVIYISGAKTVIPFAIK